MAFSQGDGASFLPDGPFQAGEQVTVAAAARGAVPARLSFSFDVDTPVVTSKIASFPNPAAAGADVLSFYTLPDAHPPVLTVTTPDQDPGAGDILTTNGPGPGQYGPLIYDAERPAGVVPAALRRAGGGGPQRADLQRAARPDVVEGAGCCRSASARAKTS